MGAVVQPVCPPCGCTTRYVPEATQGVLPPIQIVYCPLHAAAGDMRAFVRRIADRYEMEQRVGPDARVEGITHDEGQQARALLARLEVRRK